MIVYIILIIIIGAAIYTGFRCIGTPKNNYNARTKMIEEQVTSIGGTVEKVEISKSSCYPYMNEINQNDGSYHVYYRITYRLGEEIKEGWAVLKLQQSMVGPIGATTNNWIWKF